MKAVTVLIPTYNRPDALIATLTSLSGQTYRDYDVVISDQSYDDAIFENKTLHSLYRILKSHGSSISLLKNFPRRGMAQQRDFLLNKSTTPFSLFLDDDLILETYVLENLVHTIWNERCGFVGCAPAGLRFADDYRPHEERVDLWRKRVKPQKITYAGKRWLRHRLHNAANLYHVEMKMRISYSQPVKYKIAWIGACVLYDTRKLRDVGGFSFWHDLPQVHCGEDVLAQMRLMEKYGGCGLIPSGVYHQELQTTIDDRTVNAPEFIQKSL